jgi:4-amino-4-deoxy-L-arabinose transferase-like glycosyltransferase
MTPGVAMSLTRSADACRDAITQLGAIAGVAILIAMAAVALIVSPSWLRHLYDKDAEFIVILIVPAVAFAIWSNRTFRKFSETPEAADPYKSPSAVRLTNVLYVTIPVVLILLFALVLKGLDTRPA